MEAAERQLADLDGAASREVAVKLGVVPRQLLAPSIAFHFGLVRHGYEMRCFEDGRYVGSACADFDGDHKIEALKASLVDAVEKAVRAWRRKL